MNWKDHHKGCDGSSGLFQIGCVNAPVEQMKNPAENARVAYALYKSNGWNPWGVCHSTKDKNGEYIPPKVSCFN